MLKKLVLKGLDCANCASKIEQEVNELPGVNANMNFLNQTLTLETKSDVNILELSARIEGIVRKIEPNVKITYEENVYKAKTNEKSNDADNDEVSDDNNDDENRKKDIIKLVVGSVLFAVGLIFKLPNWFEYNGPVNSDQY